MTQFMGFHLFGSLTFLSVRKCLELDPVRRRSQLLYFSSIVAMSFAPCFLIPPSLFLEYKDLSIKGQGKQWALVPDGGGQCERPTWP